MSFLMENKVVPISMQTNDDSKNPSYYSALNEISPDLKPTTYPGASTEKVGLVISDIILYENRSNCTV